MAGTDLQDIEVKAAAGGLPRSVNETISAFANGSGGLLILGLDESQGFEPLQVDARALADGLAVACSDAVEPPVRAEIDIVTVDDKQVVAALIPEAPFTGKPCFVKSQGMTRGSYIRTYDGDRHLTTYEIHILLTSAQGNVAEDVTPVPDATLNDLDPQLVAALLERFRATRGSSLAKLDDTEILHLEGVLGSAHGGRRPITLAGVLALARYPQQFFPQLNTTLVVYPTLDGSPMPDGTRFLDNVSLDGPIPAQVQGAMAALTRNMSRRAVIIGLGREDRWDYPHEALREILVNAHLHRDYHSMAQGTQIQIELFPDRVCVTSPGGLFGPIAADDLFTERVSSTRNPVLARLLEDVVVPGSRRPVCENRGSGLLTVTAALRAAGMRPPNLAPSLRYFRLELSNHTLLDRDAIDWLARLTGAEGLNDRQKLGLAHARRYGAITNAGYRVVTGTDGRTATQDLVALGQAGLLIRENSGRATVWRLTATKDAAPALPGLPTPPPRMPASRQRILDALAAGERGTNELSEDLGITSQAVLRHLRILEAAGVVRATANHRNSPANTWTLASRQGGKASSPEGDRP
jgi:ATP-dependent DNA helicase RecG